MAGRKIRDFAEARSLLEPAEVSDMARAEWARANGIDGRSLNAWRLNLEQRRVRRQQPSERIRCAESACPRHHPRATLAPVGVS